MAKSKRPMVLIGYDLDGKPIYTRISGNNQDERNDNVVKAYIKSGRIWEFMPVSAYQSPGLQNRRNSIHRFLYMHKNGMLVLSRKTAKVPMVRKEVG